MKPISVGIFLFEGVEVLDFAGPFEVLSVTQFEQDWKAKPFQVATFSESGETIVARNGLKILPNDSFCSAPPFDIIVIPGGPGIENEFYNAATIQWLKERMEHVQVMASVCTGAFLLAKAGLLNGKQVTTHWASIEELQNRFPDTTVMKKVKFVDQGKIITAAGVSAGIEMSLHLVDRFYGNEMAKKTARYIEYDVDFEAKGRFVE
ncbi:DJ-1/PfpI family protein [Desmospora activa DSM 45169]|uniref:DJ-1/PfpI family protein n=2 Tax=Desmospora TaxID=500614 RepID=A0A2T4Z1L9_9BACL|nr:DJ-1/PfpI family protein [Desmospora activa DSM 45169]